MYKYFFLILSFQFILLGVTNFTINGSDNVVLNPGDEIVIDFFFSELGGSVDVTLSAAVPVVGNIELMNSENAITDGQTGDQTPVDGHYTRSINNFISANSMVGFVITLTEGETSDFVTVHFNIPDSDYSISGNVSKETANGTSPVLYGFATVLYNADMNLMTQLMTASGIDEIIEILSEDHLLVLELILMGVYEVNVPDDIENVGCIVGVKTADDFNNPEMVAPAYQTVTVNGHMSSINFLYQLPDGHFTGNISSTEGNPLSDATLILVRDMDPLTALSYSSDASGNFSIPVINGAYVYNVSSRGYQPYQNGFLIYNNDYDENIVLTPVVGIEENLIIDSDILKCYPNPFNPEINLTFQSSSSDDYKVEIYNVLGALVLSKTGVVKSPNTTLSLNLVDFNSGSYLVKLYLNNLCVSNQIINMVK
ncbi:MAG: T9SS type A sorting domain-containing protein [Candidatus Delongbacteria bacterium]|nr:T9SS type A sorting domain-containing protein [Candidatus Delongbacteria bacterium]MBN2833342.1 T9SS type A sorting domain-containing protein [Candidatus Delongbacteria bacterium]